MFEQKYREFLKVEAEAKAASERSASDPTNVAALCEVIRLAKLKFELLDELEKLV